MFFEEHSFYGVWRRDSLFSEEVWIIADYDAVGAYPGVKKFL